jgi:serine/threonine-protein kinase
VAATPAPSEPSDAIPVGTVIDGRYKISGILGAGGMGRVYRAEHTGIGRSVAIKMLHADLGRNTEAAARFQREAMASGRLDHANIIGVSDFGVLDGKPYLVMEALDGESLGERLERDKILPWRLAVEITRQVVLGLRHAHERGVVHRDIKPDNIFLTHKDGVLAIKILDFGIAKLYAGDPEDPMSTRVGLTVGTPTYLSPEQAVGAAIAPPSDLYSATVVLFEMVAGRPPFADEDPVARATAHVTRPAPTIAAVAPTVDAPPALEEIVALGLKKSVGDRIPSAERYLAMIDDVIAAPRVLHTPPVGLPVAEASKPIELPRAARAVSIADAAPPIPRRWLRASAIVVAALVVLAIILAIVYRHRSSSSPSTPPSKPAKRAEAPVAAPVVATGDPETALKAALHDLESGRTCADRKTAIGKLVGLADPRAIPSLKQARYNMHGGVFGYGAENWNACLKADAEAAIKTLGGTLK